MVTATNATSFILRLITNRDCCCAPLAISARATIRADLEILVSYISGWVEFGNNMWKSVTPVHINAKSIVVISSRLERYPRNAMLAIPRSLSLLIGRIRTDKLPHGVSLLI